VVTVFQDIYKTPKIIMEALALLKEQRKLLGVEY
jgi:hypothetical protein